jgi:hypothetical protein
MPLLEQEKTQSISSGGNPFCLGLSELVYAAHVSTARSKQIDLSDAIHRSTKFREQMCLREKEADNARVNLRLP